MKTFKKGALVLLLAAVVAVVGLTQLFHQEAYAVGLCANCYVNNNHSCPHVKCACDGGFGTSFCDTYTLSCSTTLCPN